jgi:glycosyltransferase involved in cell wall biosynthesis
VDELPEVTVIVPVRDDGDGLQACLGALGAQDYPADRFEVLVVDSASQPPIEVRAIRRPDGGDLAVRTVRVSRPGSYRARNAGIEAAQGTVLAFTDADCLPEPGWLRAAVAGLGSRDAIVTGPVQVFPRNPQRLHPAEAWELVHAFPQERYAESGWGATANMVTTRGVFDHVGLFNDRLLSGGDVSWGRRATGQGVPLVFEPAAVVRHPARGSFGELGAKLRRVHRGAYARRAEAGSPPPRWWQESMRGLTPPLGSVARGWRDPRFSTVRSRAAYTVGEFYVRYSSVAVRTRLALEASRSPRRDGA